MTRKVTLQQADHLPMPLIYLASPEDLAQWSVSQLTWDLEQGQRDLSLSCGSSGISRGKSRPCRS